MKKLIFLISLFASFSIFAEVDCKIIKDANGFWQGIYSPSFTKEFTAKSVKQTMHPFAEFIEIKHKGIEYFYYVFINYSCRNYDACKIHVSLTKGEMEKSTKMQRKEYEMNEEESIGLTLINGASLTVSCGTVYE